MNTNKPVVIKKDWCQMMIEAFRFFLQHTSIEIDGTTQVARVNYRGPHGWSLSIKSTCSEMIETSYENGNGGC